VKPGLTDFELADVLRACGLGNERILRCGSYRPSGLVSTALLVSDLTEVHSTILAHMLSRSGKATVQVRQVTADMLNTPVLNGPNGVAGWRKGLAWAEGRRIDKALEAPRPARNRNRNRTSA
jgi:hypothetical protein